jgi:hypothetical protein
MTSSADVRRRDTLRRVHRDAEHDNRNGRDGARPSDGDRDTTTAASAADSPRTFREALPIFLRHGSPRVLLVAVPVALTARLLVGQWSWWDLLPVAGTIAYWPIQEWLIHVFILHYKPVTLFGRTIDFPVPRSHRRHHRDPWNYRILFIPFHSFSYSLPLTVALWLAITPTTPLALTGIATFLLFTLHYEAVHFLVHTRVQPRGRFYQTLWRNHRLHHFKNEHYWYGVTRLEGDYLLGTAADPDSVPLSPTARTLVGEPATS